jgi:hypothetical protein
MFKASCLEVGLLSSGRVATLSSMACHDGSFDWRLSHAMHRAFDTAYLDLFA